MNVNEQNIFEQKPEHIPTVEELREVLTQLTPKEYTEKRQCADEKGLYLLEVTVPSETEKETTEYLYMRKGHYPEGGSGATEIHVVFCEDGIPISGTSAARHRYEEGDWKIFD